MRRSLPPTPQANLLGSSQVDPVPADQPLSLRALAQYSHLSVRTLRKALKDPIHPLPYYQVGRKYLVRRAAFDAWLEYYRRSADADLDRLVQEALQGLR
jgi:excisionase family DNA binding protein